MCQHHFCGRGLDSRAFVVGVCFVRAWWDGVHVSVKAIVVAVVIQKPRELLAFVIFERYGLKVELVLMIAPAK